jgi:hypothetical protein
MLFHGTRSSIIFYICMYTIVIELNVRTIVPYYISINIYLLLIFPYILSFIPGF